MLAILFHKLFSKVFALIHLKIIAYQQAKRQKDEHNFPPSIDFSLHYLLSYPTIDYGKRRKISSPGDHKEQGN